MEQLQADLQMSVGEIQFWKEQQMQEAEKFKQVYMYVCMTVYKLQIMTILVMQFTQLCRDFEELQKNNKSLQVSDSQ